MFKNKPVIISLFCAGILASAVTPCEAAGDLPLDRIKLPEGFHISVYARVPRARSLTLGDNGTVFVGTRGARKVFALSDFNRDNVVDKITLVDDLLNVPNGVAFKDGALYVAEISRILRYDDIEKRLDNPPAPVVVRDDFPQDFHHGWKFIAFGPDGKLYVPVGAPCNVCQEEDPRYASIMRMDPDGSNPEVFASGIRNTVGFDWHPLTRELWFTDNGRDLMGDNVPPDELNHAPRPGMHFGFPFCHGTDVPDPVYGKQKPCSDFTPPAQELGPHVAALGMRFYTGRQFPEEYRNRIFIAEHGSWNRTEPIGYRITTVTLDGDKSAGYEVFADGWLPDVRNWGRLADVLVMPDGALLVSDDRAGAVYRISYQE